ncbi:ABC transporter ATP-binding protein [Xenorhabdus griffiniae]|uniref:ABC transporter ATP-binding protein n=1 Tax=Xenorhabdus griffiniae TaxID=351672 RepID=A0ABY9XMZ0_9GAMM|nr:ABC transporter ATP-binding protein [Xenorhabdus griffiniae]MBD1228299.1 ABC transporter ATP-binding protein [Xenorhabdus griffiniae]MBE8586248.1 ABC transporter ATP-binding protein [Xenorhabdus griffiniae]WMV74316.1 ABC transporter ATP-binding protein [Xenorhabdus griffiniae]WNH03996.1 ABC transporter ATP-binding protein [Xenorhabdus griffiniae]
MKYIIFLYSFIRKQKTALVLAIVFTVVAALAEVVFPFLVQELVNTLLKDKLILSFSFNELIASLIAVSLLIVISHAIIIWMQTINASELSYNMRKSLVDSFLSFPYHITRKFHSANLAFRIKNDTYLVSDRVRDLYSEFLYDTLSIIGPFIAMALIDIKLAILAFMMVCLTTLISKPITNRVAVYERILQIYNSRLTGVIQESLSWIKSVKIFNSEESEKKRINDANTKVKNVERITGLFMSLSIPLGFFAQLASTIAVLWYGGLLLMDGTINPGNFVAAFTYEQLMSDSIKRYSNHLNKFASLKSLLDRVFELLGAYQPNNRKQSQSVENCSANAIDINVKKFSYNDRDTLFRDMNISIQKGERVLIVGDNGQGKSTIFDIVTGLTPLNEGYVSIFGEVLDNPDSQRWLQKFGVMSQQTQIIKGTLYDNLHIANTESTREEMISALIKAGGHELLDKLKDGLDSYIDEKGSSLSGGERQVIGLARLYLKTPEILLFDEPTTYLDNSKINSFAESLNNIVRGKTVLMISHDPRVFKLAERVIRIDKGKIAFDGSLQEYMEQARAN